MNNVNETRKKNRHVLKSGSYALTVSAIVIAIIIIVNLMTSLLPEKMIKLDMSEEKLYTVGDKTSEILSSLDTDVTLYYICEENKEDDVIKRLADSYDELSDKITLKMIDPAINPDFISKYTTESLSSNSIIAVSEKRNAVVSASDMYKLYVDGAGEMTNSEYQQFMMQYYYSTGQYPQVDAKQLFYGERSITSAVARVVSDNIPKIYFTTGHGETDISAKYRENLETENYELSSLSMISEKIPEDADAIFIVAPTSDITAEEKTLLTDYVKAGGDVILITEYSLKMNEKTPNLSSFCDFMGVKSQDGLVFDANPSNSYQSTPHYILPIVGDPVPTSPVSLMESTNVYVFVPYSHAIEIIPDRTDVTVTPVLYTSTDGYLKAVIDENTKPEKEDGDISGQFNVAVASTYASADTAQTASGGRLVWYSSTSIANSQTDISGGNSELLISTVKWMTDKTESISIIGKDVSVEPLVIDSATASVWKAILCIIVPIAVVSSGFAVWISRRRK